MLDGRIMKGIGGFYYINTQNGVYECHARGKFRKESEKPCIGDRVKISIVDEAEKQGSLDEIYPRTNQLTRPPISNVDRIVVVFTPAKPMPNLLFLDKMLVIAAHKKIDTVLCINKTDLKEAGTLREDYERCGYEVFETSAATGEGVEALISRIKGLTTVFAGSSGVGKSSLINAINKDYTLKTGKISKIERGKHTTRHVELYPLAAGGYIADTPGFSQLELNDIRANELAFLFGEFPQYFPQCKFQDCSHTKEQECGVRRAVEQGKIPRFRHDNYCALYEKLKELKEWQQR